MPVAKSSPANSNDSASAYEDDGSANYDNYDSYESSVKAPAATSKPSAQLKFETQVGNFEEEGDDDDDSKKTKAGRRKINIEYIKDKSRRHITFSKRKNGIMKKAYELATLTGTQVLLLVVSESGLVYTFTTAKLSPVVKTDEGQLIVQKCLSNQYEIEDEDDGYAPAQDKVSKRGRPSRQEAESHSLKRQRTTEFNETTLAEATKASMRAPIAPVPAVPNLDNVANGQQSSQSSSTPQNLAQFNRNAPQDEYTPRTTFYDSAYLDFDNINPTEVLQNPIDQYNNSAAAAYDERRDLTQYKRFLEMLLTEHLQAIKDGSEHYFNHALHRLLPTLQDPASNSDDRMTSVYCLIGLYLPHHISLNPFYTPIQQVLETEISDDGDVALVWFIVSITTDPNAFGFFSNLTIAEVREHFKRSNKQSMEHFHGARSAERRRGSLDDQTHYLLYKASTATLNMSEQKLLKSTASTLAPSDIPAHHIPGLINFNPHIADIVLLPVLSQSPVHLQQVTSLPPQKSVFHVLANLCKRSPQLMRNTVLGMFISNCIHWINTAEEIQENGVRFLCMFLATLLDADILQREDAVVVEITHFCLDYSKYSDAINLYTRLA
ncbi:hypothetical protein E3P99_02988 [Wallemia hederae]|uniref:MADS-box domain-containing protein n=1 Tax=Wallemia hederae TaxID=1540922 RepID=A0A4T0FHC7_9BASI|nr:hypothetical protein E3P99_02988 [Wallemia hederae]